MLHRCDGRQIVDAESAFFNDPLDFNNRNSLCIILFKGTASDESEVIDAEDNSVEYRSVNGIERTIDEDVATS